MSFSSAPLAWFSIALAIFAAISAVFFKGVDAVETWAVVAACLSVVVAALSAISGHKLVRMAWEERQPDVRITLVPRTPAGDMSVRLLNIGRTTASEVEVHWVLPSNESLRLSSLPPLDPAEFWLEFSGRQEKYEARLSWTNRAGQSFQDTFTTTDTDIEAQAKARVSDVYSSGGSELTAIWREVADLRKDITQARAEYSSAVEQAVRHLRRL